MADSRPMFFSNLQSEEYRTVSSTRASDKELDHLTPGYPKLAGYMAKRPETAIFRRFSELNMKSLLYMQANVWRLEEKLLNVERNDRSGIGNRPKYSVDSDYLASSHEDGDMTQLKLVTEIQYRLKEYNAALIQASTLFNLSQPDDFDLKNLRRWLGRQAAKGLLLKGRDSCAWGTEEHPEYAASDLVGIRPRVKEDWFSRWVAEKGVRFIKYDFGRWLKCQCCFRPKKDCSHRRYYDSSVLKWTFRSTSVFVSLLPIASIAVLLHFDNRAIKIGFIAFFNLVMAIALTFLADAKRTDCFAVTAAFTAVQVVFLGVDTQQDCTCVFGGAS